MTMSVPRMVHMPLFVAKMMIGPSPISDLNLSQDDQYMQNPGKPIEVREFGRIYRLFKQNLDFATNFLLTLANVRKFDANLTRRI